MSRTIDPDSIPGAGSSVSIAFPPFTRPKSGSWTVSVTAKATGSSEQQGQIQVLQDGQVIASQQVTLGTSDAEYTLTVNEGELNDVETGPCNVSDITVVVTALAGVCCGDLPNTLQASGGGGSGSITFDSGSNSYSGTIEMACGGRVNMGIKVWCDAPPNGTPTWKIQPFCNGEIANSPSDAVSVVCDPFELQFTYVFFNIDECDCDVHGDHRPLINVTITL